jgi:hypothetical protein
MTPRIKGDEEMGEEQPGLDYTIPYEGQSQTENNRMCGAACLSMVYRSLGQEVPQEEIWEKIAKVNRFGSIASTTHLMTKDALERGFDAVAIQARHPLFALRLCRDAGIRVILNHRFHPDVAAAGHYSVLVDLGEREVTLHDPYFGPSRRLSHEKLLRLWEPGPNSEIVGEMLIAIAPRRPEMPACEICETPVPAAIICPHCRKSVCLRPATSIGCIGEACVVRRWMHVCCPNCDYMWSTAEAPLTAIDGVPEKPEDKEDPFQFGKLFAELDKFCAAIAAMPLAAKNPLVMKQLEFMKGSKQKLTEAADKQMALLQGQHDKRIALMQKGKQAGEAKRQKLEEINKPLPPLDGTALGMALLKNMGLIRSTGLTTIMKL